MTPRIQHSILLLGILGVSMVRSQAQSPAPERFRQRDKNADGKLTRDEVKDSAAFSAADSDKDGAVTVEEYRRLIASRRTKPTPDPAQPAPVAATPTAPSPVEGNPVLKSLPDSDAVRDAAGTGQLFERTHVPGITDVRAGMNGFALADLNRDGRPRLIATHSPPLTTRNSRLAVLINEVGFRFEPHPITVRNTVSVDDLGGAAQIPNLADFNGDGFLDGVTDTAAKPEKRQRACNLYLTLARRMGVKLDKFGDSVEAFQELS